MWADHLWAKQNTSMDTWPAKALNQNLPPMELSCKNHSYSCILHISTSYGNQSLHAEHQRRPQLEKSGVQGLQLWALESHILLSNPGCATSELCAIGRSSHHQDGEDS